MINKNNLKTVIELYSKGNDIDGLVFEYKKFDGLLHTGNRLDEEIGRLIMEEMKEVVSQ